MQLHFQLLCLRNCAQSLQFNSAPSWGILMLMPVNVRLKQHLCVSVCVSVYVYVYVCQIYPYEALIVSVRGQQCLPSDVDRARLEVSCYRTPLQMTNSPEQNDSPDRKEQNYSLLSHFVFHGGRGGYNVHCISQYRSNGHGDAHTGVVTLKRALAVVKRRET